MNEQKILELVEEGSGIVGMVSEVQMKCKLLNQKRANGLGLYVLQEETDKQVERMSHELDTYRIRLNEICEEIEQYGTFSKMA
jgi:hypothetical protein